MKTVTQYREDISRLMKKLGDIDAKCITENRDLTAQEISVKEELMTGIDELRKLVSTQERQEKLNAELTSSPAPLTAPRPQNSQPEDRGQDRFKSLGEQLGSVMRAGMPGGTTDPRLFNVRAASGLSEAVSADGGFLVQTDFSTELLKQVLDTGLLASRCRKVPISGPSNSMKMNGVDETSRVSGSRYGGILGYWAGEADEKTKSKPKFRQIELSLKKLIGLCYATDELLQDAAALEGVIRDGFVSEFGFLVDDAIINGTGAGQPQGILNSGALVTVAKESGQKAATILAENVIEMDRRLFASSSANAVWLINQNVKRQLYTMSLAVGTGGIPVYMPAGGLSGRPYGDLLGRPVIPIEQCATLGTVGDIILADLGGYLLAEKGGIQSDVSIHVRFVYDESVFRFVLRIDGQPVRASALTPYKGGASDTQSHFVALTTRA